ncbi:MAG TPA: four helix bundle protein [Rhodothermales bacterium]|nr:four helix bundle protein [Rhodothermales bacterium]
MEKANFENLRVYQMAERLSDLIWIIVRGWDHFARDTIGKQIVCSADSISANLAEGTGRGTAKDIRHFARVARGSLYETKNWLRRAYRRKLLTQEQLEEITQVVQALAPMLNAYLASLSRRETRAAQAKQ